MKEKISLNLVLTIGSILSFVSFHQVAQASAYSSSSIKRVVVVGGTHGNEYTGVWCVKAIERQRQHHEKEKTCDPFTENFPSLNISTLLANSEAHLANKRFIDSDLNREFSREKLTRPGHTLDGANYCNEARIALEIDAMYGSKIGNLDDVKTDVFVDLHSTTTNMGVTFIIQEGDAVMAQAAAYVIAKMKEENENDGNENFNCLMHSIPDRNKRPNLSSIGKHGFTIEVGPVPQGVLRHDAVENTQRSLHYLFEFLHKRNENEMQLHNELLSFYPDGTVPCYRSAPAKRLGEMSGKITWPCDEENPNFPTLLVHKDIQDRDFQIIRKGDPLFVRWDGSTIKYDGSHGVRVFDEIHEFQGFHCLTHSLFVLLLG